MCGLCVDGSLIHSRGVGRDYGGCFFPRMKGKEVFELLAFGVDGLL